MCLYKFQNVNFCQWPQIPLSFSSVSTLHPVFSSQSGANRMGPGPVMVFNQFPSQICVFDYNFRCDLECSHFFSAFTMFARPIFKSVFLTQIRVLFPWTRYFNSCMCIPQCTHLVSFPPWTPKAFDPHMLRTLFRFSGRAATEPAVRPGLFWVWQ